MKKSTLIPESIYQSFRNSPVYKTFRNNLKKSMWAHYIFHSSFCFLLDNARGHYVSYTPKEWVKHHKTLKPPY